jgi:hypothetical protein
MHIGQPLSSYTKRKHEHALSGRVGDAAKKMDTANFAPDVPYIIEACVGLSVPLGSASL